MTNSETEEVVATTPIEETTSTGNNGGGGVGLEPGWVEYRHNGKRVGRISKDGLTYLTNRNPSVHLSRRHHGYGIQRRLLKDLIASKVQGIVLVESQERAPPRTFRVDPEWWFRVGSHDCLRTADGAQVFLSLRQLERNCLVPGGA